MRSLGMTFLCATLAACVPVPAAQPDLPAPPPTAPSGSPSVPVPSATPSTPEPPAAPPSARPSAPAPSLCPDGTVPQEGMGPPPASHINILAGTVLDADGAPVDGALVRVVSLDASVPYTATMLTSADGVWVVNNLPSGVRVSCRASEGDRASADVLYVAERVPYGCREPRHRLVLRLEPPLPPPSLAPSSPAR